MLEIAKNILQSLTDWNRKRVMDESELYVKAYRDDDEGALKARMEFEQIITSLKHNNSQHSGNYWDTFLLDKDAILSVFHTVENRD